MNYIIAIFGGTGFAILSAFGYLFFKTGKYQNIVDEMKITLNIVVNKLDILGNKVAALEAGIERDRYYNDLIVKESPFRITEKGYVALKESGAQKFIDNNRSILIKKVEDMNPKSSYDIQEYCKQVINGYTNSDDFIEIKEYIYEKGIDLESIVMTMMVYLRDIILVKRRSK